MIVLKVLYLFISLIFFGWTLFFSLGAGMWLYALYLLFGIGVAVIGIISRVKKNKKLKTAFYLLSAFPILLGLILVVVTIVPFIFIYISVLFHLIFSH